MQEAMLYEYGDLGDELREELKEKVVEELVKFKLNELTNMLSNGSIDESCFYKELGCSKYYAETTPWFVPSCYYEKHEDEIDKEVEEDLKDSLFTSNGKILHKSEVDVVFASEN